MLKTTEKFFTVLENSKLVNSIAISEDQFIRGAYKTLEEVQIGF